MKINEQNFSGLFGGLKSLRGQKGTIFEITWSPDGRLIASCSDDGTVNLWDEQSGNLRRRLEGHRGKVWSVSWSPDSNMLATSSSDTTIRILNVNTGFLHHEINEGATVQSVAWSPDGSKIASGTRNGNISIWNVQTFKKYMTFRESDLVRSLAWIPNSEQIASCSRSRVVSLWDIKTGDLKVRYEGHSDQVFSLSFSPNGKLLATGSEDQTIHVWETKSSRQLRVLEGHTGIVRYVRFSPDGQLLASKSDDGTIRFWRCADWEPVAEIGQRKKITWGGLAFHPKQPVFATGPAKQLIQVWEMKLKDILRGKAATSTIQYTSAKIVIVGESNVGKSCLAMRLAEDRYPEDHEQGTTHGMRFWQMKPEQLSLRTTSPEEQRRDIVLWDLGGQDDYRLVHQLFLHDTTLALFLIDPTRGRTAIEEVEAWNKNLEKQLRGHKAVKLLIGSKMDQKSQIIDQHALEHLVKKCNFLGYYETSARTGRGIAELKEEIAKALDWESLAKTSRPELFQLIRDEISKRQKNSEVVLAFSDLEKSIQKKFSHVYESSAVNAVTEQLAKQGIIANSRLPSGERAIVLQVGEIERYAGSVILKSRNNPRGVPALETRVLASKEVQFPGINEINRLPRVQEHMVLGCVVLLLIEHGICFEHEGLLIFPSLFRQKEQDKFDSVGQSISLHYDFSGAIDNIYASLVASLVMIEDFGRVRLWRDRAEFEYKGHGSCGLQKVDRGRGFANLALYFEDKTIHDLRELFITFVEEHLRRGGVEIIENLEIICSCGYCFTEDIIRERISNGASDIGCPKCDRRTEINEGAKETRTQNPDIERKTWALRTEIEKRTKRIVSDVKQVFTKADSEIRSDRPIYILHLSDLHFGPGVDPESRLRPLIADMKGKNALLGGNRLDFLVLSGDLVNKAMPEEFEAARRFLSGMIKEFELTAERCMIIPGNHDLSWDEDVYVWKQKRQVNRKDLTEGHFLEQGDGILIRDEERYHLRFRNFSESFYHPLIQLEYPKKFDDQFGAFLFERESIQFLTLNSSWEIDEWSPHRSGIHSGALSRGLAKLEEQVNRLPNNNNSMVRIAVCHHPVTGNEKILDEAFLEQLRKADIRILMHGHVHENRADLIGYLHPDKIHIIGAGTFSASWKARPESIPRLYNLLEINSDRSSIKVHTRGLSKEGGAWEGWAKWPGSDPTQKRTYYTIEL